MSTQTHLYIKERLNVATVATFNTQNVAAVAAFKTQNVATLAAESEKGSILPRHQIWVSRPSSQTMSKNA